MREDSGGDFFGGRFILAGGGALGVSWSFGGANFWNPVGWVVWEWKSILLQEKDIKNID